MEEESKLRQVSANRPQLVQFDSRLSVAASDDYFSADSEQSLDRPKAIDAHSSGNAAPQTRTHGQIIEGIFGPSRPVVPVSGDESPITGLDSHPPLRAKAHSTASSTGTITPLPRVLVSSPEPLGTQDTPHIHYAIQQISRDQRNLVLDYSITDAPSTDEASLSHHDTTTVDEQIQTDPVLAATESSENTSHDEQTTSAPLPPPNPPDPESFQGPRLTYKPKALRTWTLMALITCCVLIIAALAFCGAYPIYHDGLYEYDGTGTSRYFVFEYLPQIIAAAIIFWLMAVQSAIHRIYPFVTLASGRGTKNGSVLLSARLFPTNHLFPNIEYLRHGGPWLAIWAIMYWLAMFTVPLMSCLFQTQYYITNGGWRWTTVTPVAWTLFAIYILLTISLVVILLKFARCSTGLRWDPVCLADIMTIFHHSNILSDFDRQGVYEMTNAALLTKDIRLGYWFNNNNPSRPWYGIADENLPVRRYSLEGGRTRLSNESLPLDTNQQGLDLSAGHDKEYSRDLGSRAHRYRWTPWFLRRGMVLIWCGIAIALLIALLVVSYVHLAATSGFKPQLSAQTSTRGFSSADFLFSFIPSLLGMIMFLIWQPIDMYHRALQPFVDLSLPHGSSALALLLDYPARPRWQVSIMAFLNAHYKVAFVSFIATISIVIPVIAGGVFTTQFIASSSIIRTIASAPGFTALIVFIIIYVLAFIVLIFPLPNKTSSYKRYLPHDISTLADLVSYFNHSQLLTESIFGACQSKAELESGLCAIRAGETSTGGSGRFAFGIYTSAGGISDDGLSRKGRRYIGIDRLRRAGSPGMILQYQ